MISLGQHSKLLCCPVFSLPFNALLIFVLLQPADEVPDSLDFLSPVTTGFGRRLDDNTGYHAWQKALGIIINVQIIPPHAGYIFTITVFPFLLLQDDSSHSRQVYQKPLRKYLYR